MRDTINSGSGHVAILQLRIGGVGGGASQWGIFMEETMPQVYTLVDYAVCFVLHWLKNLNNIMTRKYFLLNSCFLLIKFSQLTNAGLKMQIINVFVLKYKKYDDPIQSPIPKLENKKHEMKIKIFKKCQIMAAVGSVAYVMYI